MDDGEDSDTAAAMAAALGFSSFGAQKPNKRRKFNPGADAFVASTSGGALPFHSDDYDNTQITGSNKVPLGLRRRNMNTDEIDLGDDDEDGEQPPPTVPATRQATTYSDYGDGGDDGNVGDYDAEEPESRYLDTSRPSAPIVADPVADPAADPAADDDLQSKIDAIVGSSTHAHASPQQSSSSVVGGSYPGRGGYGEHQRHMNRDGRSGAKWWEGYYDPGSITNPWDSLEKAKGLEPYGSWMSWEEAKAART
ncbi:hypothetical protein F5B18DRAFT_422162 [Nemania serpens]|nr:hypothetical protein F5B18DRAFT_422162 [Nemania serpens]